MRISGDKVRDEVPLKVAKLYTQELATHFSDCCMTKDPTVCGKDNYLLATRHVVNMLM